MLTRGQSARDMDLGQESLSSCAEECAVSAAYSTELNDMGAPDPLIKHICSVTSGTARIYIIDNSRSTLALGGSIRDNVDGQMIDVSIWDEIKDTVLRHARFNVELGVPAEFYLLNSGTQPHHTNKVVVRGKHDIAAVRQMLSRDPRGGTPLVKRVGDIMPRVKHMLSVASKVYVTVITDGIPDVSTRQNTSSPNSSWGFVKALRDLSRLGEVDIIIRLCTDDEETVEFYSDVDHETESEGFNVDVVDDLLSEARRVLAVNPWFIYTPALHMIREAGLGYLFDHINERPLAEGEKRRVQALFRSDLQVLNPLDGSRGVMLRRADGPAWRRLIVHRLFLVLLLIFAAIVVVFDPVGARAFVEHPSLEAFKLTVELALTEFASALRVTADEIVLFFNSSGSAAPLRTINGHQ